MKTRGRYVVMDEITGNVYFRDEDGKVVGKFNYSFYKDLNEIRIKFDRLNREIDKFNLEMKQKELF